MNKFSKGRDLTEAEKHYFAKMGHNGIAHPGIGTSNPNMNRKMYHVFYQWVGFIIFFQVCSFFMFFENNILIKSIQAILFYLPRHLWKWMEDGRIKFCSKDVKEIELNDEKRKDRVDR